MANDPGSLIFSLEVVVKFIDSWVNWCNLANQSLWICRQASWVCAYTGSSLFCHHFIAAPLSAECSALQCKLCLKCCSNALPKSKEKWMELKYPCISCFLWCLLAAIDFIIIILTLSTLLSLLVTFCLGCRLTTSLHSCQQNGTMWFWAMTLTLDWG